MTELQALVAQLLFGLVYNRVIGRGFLRDLVSIQVVLGIMGVLVIAAHVRDDTMMRLAVNGVPLSNAQHAAWFLFKQLAAAGLPMVSGSLRRQWGQW